MKRSKSITNEPHIDNPYHTDNIEFLRVTDWNETQGTVGHNLKFVKIMADLYRSPSFLRLPNSAKDTYYPLLQFAATNHNKIPNDPILLGGILHLDGPADFAALLEYGFLEPWCEIKHQQMVVKYEAKLEQNRIDQQNSRNKGPKKRKKRAQKTTDKPIPKKTQPPPNSVSEPDNNLTSYDTDLTSPDQVLTKEMSVLETRDLETRDLKHKIQPAEKTPVGSDNGVTIWDEAFWTMMQIDIHENFPDHKFRGKRDWQNETEIKNMRQKDNRSKEEIEAIWDHTTQHPFWGSRVLTAFQFRRLWTTLKDDWMKTKGKKPAGQKYDGITQAPVLTESEALEKIDIQIAFAKKEIKSGIYIFDRENIDESPHLILAWNGMVARYVWNFEEQFKKDPLNSHQRKWFNEIDSQVNKTGKEKTLA